MNKSTTFYAALALGVVALIAGIVLLMMKHHMSAYGGIAVGVVLIVAGIAGTVMSKSKGAEGGQMQAQTA